MSDPVLHHHYTATLRFYIQLARAYLLSPYLLVLQYTVLKFITQGSKIP